MLLKQKQQIISQTFTEIIPRNNSQTIPQQLSHTKTHTQTGGFFFSKTIDKNKKTQTNSQDMAPLTPPEKTQDVE